MHVPHPIPSLAVALAALAATANVWLLGHSWGDRRLPGCGTASACDAVAKTRWSRLGPVPIALPGTATYLALAVALAWVHPALNLGHREAVWRCIGLLVLVVGGSALWFLALQLVVLRRVCSYCTIAHIAGLAVMGVVMVVPGRWGVSSSLPISSSLVWGPAAAALFLLVGGQTLISPKMFTMRRAEDATGGVVRVALGGQPREAVLEPAPRKSPAATGPMLDRPVPLLSGRVTLSTARWPVLGDAAATHVVAFLFDYTCKDCRTTSTFLLQARVRYGPRLAVLAVPVPHSPLCNPQATTAHPNHSSACQYARLGLAVWRKEPARFADYHDWMCEKAAPPPLEGALRYAQKLAELTAFDPDAAGAEIDAQIAKAVALQQAAGAPVSPAILLPNGVLAGRLPSARELFHILEQEMPLRSVEAAFMSGVQ